MTPPSSLNACVNEKEPIYFWMVLAFTVLYALIILGYLGAGIAMIVSSPKMALAGGFMFAYLGFYGLLFAAFLFFAHGALIGWIQGNGVKITPQQFPEVHARAVVLAEKIGLPALPQLYVLQEGGVLNAFATQFFRRNYAVLYSEVMELAYQEGQDALDFIIAHEFAHLQRRHVEKNLWLFLGLQFPFLGNAYYRACEYTCDAMAAFVAPAGAIKGLSILAAGKQLHHRLNPTALIAQAEADAGFWCWMGEISSSHPHLYKRMAALLEQLPASAKPSF